MVPLTTAIAPAVFAQYEQARRVRALLKYVGCDDRGCRVTITASPDYFSASESLVVSHDPPGICHAFEIGPNTQYEVGRWLTETHYD